MDNPEAEQTAKLQSRHEETDDGQFGTNQFGETIFLGDEPSKQATPAKSEIPRKIGRYKIKGVLGKGGMGAVYRGFDKQLQREVAIKVPLIDQKDRAEEFMLEARQIAQLSHPSIVTVHDVGAEDDTCYIVSEFLEGQDLNHYMKSHTLQWQEAARMIATLADALAAAHTTGVVHRDVKPGNIIIIERGDEIVPVLVDFGLALSKANLSEAMRSRGVVAGTPNYMSPEQACGEGHRIDGRTDIYALGVTLYRLVSGQLPFSADTVTHLLQAIVQDEPRPPRQFVRGLPRELERICLKAMAKNLSDRYTTAADLSEDLRNLIREQENKAESAPASVTTNETSTRREAAKILIADDHQLSRFKLENDLKKWGHEVTVAEDGEQAWELFQKNEFAIVITDWMMPKMDGLELVKLIRAAERSNYVYVIMLTAKAEKHDIVAGMGSGADDFLTKPFHRDELQVRLRAGIRITNLNRELSNTNQRLIHTQEAAAQIQESFLPTIKPRLAGFEVAWEHCSSGKLGGDMFNVVSLDSSHVGVYILDVEGEGAPAALLATTLSRLMGPSGDATSILVDHGEDGASPVIREPVDVAKELNQRFGVQEHKQFFTFTYGVLNLNTREFRFTSAGHPPLLHQNSDGSPSMIDVEGYPIGMAPDWNDFEQRSISLQPGDRLLLLSDGFPDAMSSDGEVFGAARLLESVSNHSKEPVDEMLQNLIDQLDQWRADLEIKDDASIVAIEAL